MPLGVVLHREGSVTGRQQEGEVAIGGSWPGEARSTLGREARGTHQGDGGKGQDGGPVPVLGPRVREGLPQESETHRVPAAAGHAARTPAESGINLATRRLETKQLKNRVSANSTKNTCAGRKRP